MPDKAKPDDPAQSQRFIDVASNSASGKGIDAFEQIFDKLIKNTQKVSKSKISKDKKEHEVK